MLVDYVRVYRRSDGKVGCDPADRPIAGYISKHMNACSNRTTRVQAGYTMQIGNTFGGLFALAVLTLDGKAGLEDWAWLFILEGALTVLLAAILRHVHPQHPVLHPLAHRAQPQYRVEVDRSSKYATDEVSLWDSTKMAVKDPKTWLLCSILQFALAVALVLGRHTRVLDVSWLAVGDTLAAADPVENYQRPEIDNHEGKLGCKEVEAPADPRDIAGRRSA
ncbi:hypothetical protein EHS25_001874 [Saitozyma podzolica]|uniref:Major facilitator superfamily (MFS) profile domain-containing protein n=1 Tax=Saitozyma podzolica TaxID=1890683 RepID=A0A427YFL6_9TREE|nr:hypothetical protein EHS25_001874 [Saitozyma podzolica]